MRQGLLTLSLAAVVLLAGAGCSDIGTTENKPAEGTTTTLNGGSTSTVSTEKMANKAIDSIELSGEAIGENMAQFTWKIPEGAKDPTAFRLVRGQNENPTQPPGYWFRQPGKARGTVWVKLPKGEQHFRICVYEDGACGVYSNDLVVDVK